MSMCIMNVSLRTLFQVKEVQAGDNVAKCKKMLWVTQTIVQTLVYHLLVDITL